MSLPPCEQRAEIGDPERYFCRHTSVHVRHHLVDARTCHGCRVREMPCDEPRPVPDTVEVGTAPSVATRAWNVARALVDFVSDGCRTVDRDTYEARLRICDDCPERYGSKCRQCGCRLALKARGRAFDCPLGRWSAVGEREERS